MTSARDPQPDSLLPLSPQVFHILIALAGGEQHGYAIMQDVAARSGGKLRLSPGTLYGSIKRMLEQGIISELQDRERPKRSDDDERRRYYRLTSFGRKVVKAEAARSRRVWNKPGCMDWRPIYRSVFRALLRVYPAEFREEYGAEMDLLVAQQASRESQYRLWLTLLEDVLRKVCVAITCVKKWFNCSNETLC